MKCLKQWAGEESLNVARILPNTIDTTSATFYSHDHFNFCAICKEIKIDDVICLYFYVQGINCGHMITGSDDIYVR